jgi:hypothetical protein
MNYVAGQRVVVQGENAIVVEQSDTHGWVNCEFPERDRFRSGGWVNPAHIRCVSPITELSSSGATLEAWKETPNKLRPTRAERWSI